ncbi:MAG: hypothetical protein A2Z04_06475 [Chloroflexi bacterium RBG_16_57_9]|nr:MAG: hypothetical protein A2Z04_06475 [Chloroflexi bacterium RBG_16_57_9]
MQRLRASAGLCRQHAWKLAGLGCAYQTTAMYQYLVEDQQARLRRLRETLERATAASQRPWNRSRARLELARREAQPAATCPACTETSVMSERALRELVAGLNDPELRDLFVESDGLCVPHFVQALEFASERELPILVEVQQAKLATLQRDLTEYMRKVDYQFADEPKGEEQTAWRRAIAFFAGPQLEWW